MPEGWECVDGCPVKAMDEQGKAAGVHGAGKKRDGGQANQSGVGGLLGVGNHEGNGARYGDDGGPSRFFKTFPDKEELKQLYEARFCSGPPTSKAWKEADARCKEAEARHREEPTKGGCLPEIIQGDCLEVLKGMESDSLDACITDPPYGLSKEPDVAEVMTHWLAGDDYKHRHSGFMGRSWDSFVPGPATWKEVYRVMKPGAYLLAFCGTRTWDLMSMAIRLAGFENRDTISHEGPPAIRWCYGSGFPKSHNVSKAIDKMAGAEREVVGSKNKTFADNPLSGSNGSTYTKGNGYGGYDKDGSITTSATEAARQWEGFGTALKPSWEVILMFRKPLSEKSVARQVLKTSTGALNIDASRVGTAKDLEGSNRNGHSDKESPVHVFGPKRMHAEPSGQGRWPSNLLLSHIPPDENGEGGCQRVGEKRVKGTGGAFRKGPQRENGGYDVANTTPIKHQDPEGMETVADYRCEKNCPVRLMDAQSGTLKSGGGDKGNKRIGTQGYGSNSQPWDSGVKEANEGGASRFFKQFTPDTSPGFVYKAKASRRDRTANGAVENSHPTCKPTSLMKYLLKMVVPPGGRVLDPFCGSGSTLVAAQELGIEAIGIEQDEAYCEIARKRLVATANISDVQENLSLFERDDNPLG